MVELGIDADTRRMLSFERKVRDPIYNYIPLTELECLIIDTPAYQRLDRIGQMHSVYKVYPGADYSRKVHSLGALHLIGKAVTRLLYLQCDVVREGVPSTLFANEQEYVEERPGDLDDLSYLLGIFDEYDGFEDLDGGEEFTEEINQSVPDLANLSTLTGDETMNAARFVYQSVRVLALIHDVGHGPFSHKIENIDEISHEDTFDHEEMGPKVAEIIKSQAKENMDDYSETAVENFEVVVDFARMILASEVEEMERMKYLRQLVDHPFDCDMLDYIVRDAYFAGTPEYGEIDSERIVKGYVVHKDRLRISQSEIRAIRSAFESVFDMYRTVYTHKTVRMYDHVLDEAFSNIPDFIEEITGDERKLVEYDDQTFISHIENKARNGNHWDQCLDDLNTFRNREKPYEELYRAPLAVNVKSYLDEVDPDPDERADSTLRDHIWDVFEEIKQESRESNADPEQILFDPAFGIRRVGLGMNELFNWIQRDILRQADRAGESTFVPFLHVDPDIQDRVLTMEVPARVFAKRAVPEETKRHLETYSREAFERLRHDTVWLKTGE